MPELVPHSSGSFAHPGDPGEPSTGHPRLSITGLEAEIIAAFVVGRDVIEIGTGLGVSTRALAWTARSVLTVDIDEWVQATIWPDLPPNVITSPVVPTERRFDAAFIDGDHSSEAVARDLAAVLPLLSDDAVVIAHDTNYGNVRAGLPMDRFCHIPTTHGIGIHWLGRDA